MARAESKLRSWSLWARLGVLAAAVAIAAGGAAAALTYAVFHDTLVESELAQVERAASGNAQRLEGAADFAARDAGILAELPLVQAGAARAARGGADPVWHRTPAELLADARPALRAVAASEPAYLQVRLLGRRGRELIRIDRSPAGLVVVAAADLQDKAGRDYVVHGLSLERGTTWVSALEPNREWGAIQEPVVPVLRAAAPVFAGDVRVGLIVVNVDVRDVYARASDLPGSTWVLGPGGDVLLQPDSDQWFARERGRPFLRLSDVAPGTSPEGLLRATRIDGDGGPQVAAARVVRTGALDVTVVQVAPLDALTAASRRATAASGLGSLLIVLLAALAAGVAARRVTRPLQQMAAAAAGIGASDVDTALPVDADGEVGQLARALDRMRTRIDRATADLAARAAELQRSNDALSAFAHAASHDLRTPLRGIVNLAQWLEDDAGDALDDESRRNLARLRARAERMERMLQELLVYSDVGGREEARVSTTPAAVVEAALDQADVPDAFRVEVDASDTPITTTWGPLVHVVQNLLTNAVRHHHTGSGVIRVRAHSTGATLHVEVADDGPGIPPEYHDKVFEPFQTLSRRADSSGVGLAFVKRAVEANAGTVWLEGAEPGLKVCFTWSVVVDPEAVDA